MDNKGFKHTVEETSKWLINKKYLHDVLVGLCDRYLQLICGFIACYNESKTPENGFRGVKERMYLSMEFVLLPVIFESLIEDVFDFVFNINFFK